MDSYQGSNYDPASLHKYLYVGADPANKVDPSGRMSVAEVSVVSMNYNTLAAMSVLSLATVCYFQFALAETANYFGADTSSVQSPCVRKNNTTNRMRVQLQEGFTHLASADEVAPSNPGVTVMQMQIGALMALFLEGKGIIPGRLESAFLGAIARTSMKLADFRAGGGVRQAGEIWDEEFGDRGVIYRVDLENLRGHNLRR
jgi:hypothetical protein